MVTLDASKSVDAEGDKLAFLWWMQPEASSYESNIDINNVNGSKTSVRIPEDAKGKTIHIICEVTDNGKIPLTSYARVISIFFYFSYRLWDYKCTYAVTAVESHLSDACNIIWDYCCCTTNNQFVCLGFYYCITVVSTIIYGISLIYDY